MSQCGIKYHFLYLDLFNSLTNRRVICVVLLSVACLDHYCAFKLHGKNVCLNHLHCSYLLVHSKLSTFLRSSLFSLEQVSTLWSQRSTAGQPLLSCLHTFFASCSTLHFQIFTVLLLLVVY